MLFRFKRASDGADVVYRASEALKGCAPSQIQVRGEMVGLRHQGSVIWQEWRKTSWENAEKRERTRFSALPISGILPG